MADYHWPDRRVVWISYVSLFWVGYAKAMGKIRRPPLTSPNFNSQQFIPGIGTPGIGRGIQTRFKKGVDYECRKPTYYQKGNYRGYPSKEAWSAAYKGVVKKKRERLRAMKRHVDIVKEARDIQDMARDLSTKVIEAMAKIVDSENSTDVAKIAAGNVILERAYGKAAQTNINATVNTDGKPNEITGAELDRRIASALDRVEKLTGGKREEGEGQDRSSDLRQLH